MIIHGQVVKTTDAEVFIRAPLSSYLVDKRRIDTVEIIVTDGRHISAAQRKHIYATLRDISLYTGHDVEDLKSIFKADYIATTGEPWFSLSNVDMTTASNYLQHLIEFCLVWGIPTLDSYLDRAPDVSRYLYMCLATRTCVLCGKKAEVHHSGEDRVGMGRNRQKISHLGLQAVALCAEHHRLGKGAIHNIPESEFFEKNHIYPIRLDEHLCKQLGLRI
ncbi:putative HNHc nuclease [Desulfitobacterium chlororespirans]|uniref:Putative HNHc nuclease n=1 Tax=Desulfitobacterium chlororespirans DSM 11544 TaxID=1121395 RepID=A0A1M7U3G9_9FIRM|nr:putative HNHc nuclease [Desulfitobacterium chlororespirans]SHN77496.1 Putative HNHc nuclease [Desulfitobacterium chlororespirans DSM 11544]